MKFTVAEEAMPSMLYCNNQTGQVKSTFYNTLICSTANSWVLLGGWDFFTFVKFAKTVITASTSDLPSGNQKA